MKKYIRLNNINENKLELFIFILNQSNDYILVKKHVLLRSEFKVLTFDLMLNTINVYVNSIGSVSIDQTDETDKTFKFLEINNVAVESNEQLYDTLKLL